MAETKETTNFKTRKKWLKALNAGPRDSWIQIRDLGGKRKSLFMPLTVQEALADIFFDEINVIDINTKVIINELIIIVKIHVLPSYPNSDYITLMGVAAKPIQMKSGGIAAKFPAKKVTNALEYIAPAAKSAAISNAFTSFKNVFGRNLNRKVSNKYNLSKKKKKDKK